MKAIFSILICLSFFSVQAQNSSFGVGLSAFSLEGSQGLYTTANVRTQLTNVFGWSTEVGHGRMNQVFSTTVTSEKFGDFGQLELFEKTTTERQTFLTGKTGITTKFLSKNGMNLEAIVSGGAIRTTKSWFGFLSGELFLSVKISNNIVAGIPLGFHYITWERDRMLSGGLSLRFHL